MKKDAIYINVAMGLGGNISLTYVTPELKEHYKTVAVCSPYWDVFESDPNVDLVYKPEQIRDFIYDAQERNAFIMNQRLYDMSEFIYKEISYSDAWRKLCNIPMKRDGDEGSTGTHTLTPYVKFPSLEQTTNNFMKPVKDKYSKFILVNFEGGVSPLVQVPAKLDNRGNPIPNEADWSQVPDNYNNEPLARHYPRELAREFIMKFMKAHPDTAVIDYSLPNQGGYNVGEIKTIIPYLSYYEISKMPECVGAVTIDSSLQHLITGNCKVITLWGHSEPRSFGHVGNKNIIQHCRRNEILYFSALGPSGAKVDYISPDDLLSEVDKYLYDSDKV